MKHKWMLISVSIAVPGEAVFRHHAVAGSHLI
jgi:hypothetical protein